MKLFASAINGYTAGTENLNSFWFVFGNFSVKPTASWWKLRYHEKLIFLLFLLKRNVKTYSLKSSINISKKKCQEDSK